MIAEVRSWIDAASRIVALTGAGISTDSGIPDFRGPRGVWTKDPLAEKLSNIHHYLADAEVRKASWQNRLHSSAWQAKPNPGHFALVDLERRGKLHALITQNIDELHQLAGNSPERVVEVHGTMRKFMCWGCGTRGPMQSVLERVRAGEEDPRCEDCGGILKSDTISFGQNLVPEVIDRAMRVAGEADRGNEPSGLSHRGSRRHRAAGGSEDRDPERAADALRRGRRRGAARLDQRSIAGDLRLDHRRTAVHHQRLAGDERGVLAREEAHRADQVLGMLVARDGA